ncbi:DNA-dependent metalloprotease SPRTN-like [Chironomus tepperi]|uniref:DNA-dependent metalloprotease SPRTN-like n=1 Tax=Chironomus tepperi TaxID=113505 RepID=UPI00391F05F1
MNRINNIKKSSSFSEQESNKSIIFVPPSSPQVIVLDDSEDDEANRGTEYYNEELNIWIDMENPREWKEVDIKPDIDMIFNKLKKKFFGDEIDPEFKIYYDLNHAICDGSAFKILEKSKVILINRSSLTRPRIQQISIILHILIHLFLNKVSAGKISISKHDDNFRNIMHYLNDRLFTCISVNHKFTYIQDEEDYPKQWWFCTGICQNYSPFRGIIRSPIMPNESMIFWQLHHTKCTGTFFKIFEIRQRISSDEVDIKYIRSPSYMNPQAEDIRNKVTAKVHQVVKNPIREQVDLTADNESPVVKNLCDVIDLDDSQYNIVDQSSTYLQKFITLNLSVNENVCPFCLNVIMISRMAAHFDVCMGYQPQVQYSPSVRR